jgi:glycogen debranching enzyme
VESSEIAARETFNRVMGAARFGIPSQALSAASFDHLRYWRGPVWAIMNYMAGTGMAEQGLTEAARACAPTLRG